MRYLTSYYFWASVLSGLIFLGAASYYINQATKLSIFIDKRCPELWQKMSEGFVRPKAGRLEYLVLFNTGAKDHPDDPAFNRLLNASRLSAAVSLISFVAALVLLGLWRT
jgi:hypothetical protein